MGGNFSVTVYTVPAINFEIADIFFHGVEKFEKKRRIRHFCLTKFLKIIGTNFESMMIKLIENSMRLYKRENNFKKLSRYTYNEIPNFWPIVYRITMTRSFRSPRKRRVISNEYFLEC